MSIVLAKWEARKPVKQQLLRRFDEATGEPGAILINGRTYLYEVVPAASLHCECQMMIRLFGGESDYTVTLLNDGRVDCDCGDHVFRFEKDGMACKHAVAAIESGIFPQDESAALDDDTATSGRWFEDDMDESLPF